MTKRFYINYQTGAGNEVVEGTLKDAMAVAKEGICYTGCNVTISDDDTDEEIACLPWYGVEYDEERDCDCTPVCEFGEFGFYGEWVIY